MQHSLESVGCAKASVIQLCCMLYVVDSIAHVAGLKGIGACDMNSKQNNQWVIGCQAANDRNKPPRLLKALVSFISTSMSSHSPNFCNFTLTFATSRLLSTSSMPSAGQSSHTSQPTLNGAQHGITEYANLYSTQAEVQCRRARASQVIRGMLGSQLSDHSSCSRR